MTMLNERQQLSYIAAQAADARLNVELETEGMTLNIGPQHPATHGTLRIVTRLDGEQVSRTGPTGLRLRELPKHMFSIWNNIQATDKLGFGIGLTAQDETFADNGNTATLPAYARVDMAVFYQLNDNLRLQVNVENLTDELYFPNAHSANELTVAPPMNARVTITGRF